MIRNIPKGRMNVKIIARHFTADLYNCKYKKLADAKQLEDMLRSILNDSSFHILKMDSSIIGTPGSGHLALSALMQEGHIVIHAYDNLKYVAADVFVCAENADPERLFKDIRKYLKPDKLKTTYLKRGDFGTITDMKPRTKTKVAPLRRINNAGARVVRLLAHRKRRR